MNIKIHISECLKKIKTQSPVIHNITNFVVMNSSANILLALGASPVMAHCESEVEEMVSLSNSLVLNIGTIDNTWIISMEKASKKANNLKIPIILDVVGAGATQFRTKTSLDIINRFKLSVIRGNASEILALTTLNVKTKGVDSSIELSEKVINAAKKLATSKNCIVAISGEKDIITNGDYVTYVTYGHPIMSKITGMGCGLSAVTSAFCAVSKNKYLATVSAFAFYGACGDITAKKYHNQPGSFFPKFLDTIYSSYDKKIYDFINITLPKKDSDI